MASEKHWLSPSFVTTGSKLGIAEAIRGGITCFNDMYFFPERTAEVVISSGIMVNLGIVVLEYPNAWAKDSIDYIKKGENCYNDYNSNSRLTFSYAPHAPYTVSDKTLKIISKKHKKITLTPICIFTKALLR